MKRQPSKNRRFKSYDDLVAHTDKPLAQRRKLTIGRSGTAIVPRRFHLTAEEVAEVQRGGAMSGSGPPGASAGPAPGIWPCPACCACIAA